MQSTNAGKKKHPVLTRLQKKHTKTKHPSNKKISTCERTRKMRRKKGKQKRKQLTQSALYIKELMEDWSSVNTIRTVVPKKINSISFNKEAGGECWVRTKCNNIVMDWLADTDSPRSFMEHAKAKEITNNNKASRITTFDEKSR